MSHQAYMLITTGKNRFCINNLKKKIGITCMQGSQQILMIYFIIYYLQTFLLLANNKSGIDVKLDFKLFKHEREAI